MHIFPFSLGIKQIAADILIHLFNIEDSISKINTLYMDKKGDPQLNELLIEELRKVAVMNGFSGEYRYWVLLCGLFNAEKPRNIVNHWVAHEKAFLKLVEQDGKLGPKHLLQAIILFFIRRYPTEMGQYAATFMKKLYD